VGHTYTNILLHLIFSTKDRRPALDPDLRAKLVPYVAGILDNIGGACLAMNGVADHMHMLISSPATLSVSDLLRDIKANSSRWVHETFPSQSEFAWQTGYGAFSVSLSSVAAVKQYIAGQEEHHRTVSFQEEFLAFLERHGIEYDPRYIWE
jgi:putative transposase